MWVEFVHLTDVRSYPDVQVELEAGITTLLGRNGRGKTNFVEALAYCSTLGSHRVSTDTPLIRQGAPHGVIRARVVDGEHRTTIDLALYRDQPKKARINQSPVTRVRDVLGIVQTVIFAPEDLAIVKGDPADRRRFLDDVLIQRRPAYAGIKADYERVLKQRNALLKSARANRRSSSTSSMMQTLEVWNEQLIETGTAMIVERCAGIEAMQPHLVERYAFLADGAQAVMQYDSALTETPTTNPDVWRSAFSEHLAQRQPEELDRGITLVGPHRDDIALSVNGLPAKGYASHGESWSLALALRLASADIFIEQGRSPVLILDDVFAELDAKRRSQLASLIRAHEQVLITAAVEEDVPHELVGNRLMVDDGQITRVP